MIKLDYMTLQYTTSAPSMEDIESPGLPEGRASGLWAGGPDTNKTMSLEVCGTVVPSHPNIISSWFSIPIPFPKGPTEIRIFNGNPWFFQAFTHDFHDFPWYELLFIEVLCFQVGEGTVLHHRRD